MQQIKFFKGVENDLGKLESEINEWLASNQVRVLQVFGNLAPQSTPMAGGAGAGLSNVSFPASDVFMCVLYEAGAIA